MSDSKLPASVQFYDALTEITQMRERRFSVIKIWEHLKEKGKYTGDYSHFLRLVKKEFGTAKPAKATPPKRAVARRITPSSSAKEEVREEVKEEVKEEDGPMVFMEDLGRKHD